jgi:hypothetical protein
MGEHTLVVLARGLVAQRPTRRPVATTQARWWYPRQHPACLPSTPMQLHECMYMANAAMHKMHMQLPPVTDQTPT